MSIEFVTHKSIKEKWSQYRRLWRKTFGGIGVFSFSALVSILYEPNVILAFACVFFVVWVFFYANTLFGFKCPRCDKYFYSFIFAVLSPFKSSCSHCGLRVYEKDLDVISSEDWNK